jgi:alkaline phosphatase D
MSCSSLAYGYFNAYRSVAARADVDAIVHLGDYIYEQASGAYGKVRAYEPAHELFTLDDYRKRYAQYRSDPDLQEAHRQLPFLVVWDDHEVANNAWQDGAPEHDPDSPVSYAERKAAAQQAFFEWLPIRQTTPGRVHRAFGFGDLVHLILADTRHWGRDALLETSDPSADDETRTILGNDQEAWLKEELTSADTRWRILAQQVVFSELDIGVTNADAWDGYSANRERILQLIQDEGLDNVVILTGDIHMSWAFDVIRQVEGPSYDPDTGLGSIAVELVTPAITSPGFDQETGELVAEAALKLPEVRLAQLWQRGYLLLDIDQQRLQGEWYLFDTVEKKSEAAFYRALQVRAGESHLHDADAPAVPPSASPELAPNLEELDTSS